MTERPDRTPRSAPDGTHQVPVQRRAPAHCGTLKSSPGQEPSATLDVHFDRKLGRLTTLKRASPPTDRTHGSTSLSDLIVPQPGSPPDRPPRQGRDTPPFAKRGGGVDRGERDERAEFLTTCRAHGWNTAR